MFAIHSKKAVEWLLDFEPVLCLDHHVTQSLISIGGHLSGQFDAVKVHKLLKYLKSKFTHCRILSAREIDGEVGVYTSTFTP